MQYSKHLPIWKAGDSTAALNRSNGTRENTSSNTSRPEVFCDDGEVDSGEGETDPFAGARLWTLSVAGRVTTKYSNTSSRNR